MLRLLEVAVEGLSFLGFGRSELVSARVGGEEDVLLAESIEENLNVGLDDVVLLVVFVINFLDDVEQHV